MAIRKGVRFAQCCLNDGGRLQDNRALALIEILIAIALLLAIAALAMPAVVRILEQRSFESAVEMTVSQLLIARAHAQATGNPVEVLYHSDPPRVEARFFDPALRPIAMAEYRDAQLDVAAGDSVTAFDVRDDEARGDIAEGWAWREIPRAVKVTRELSPAVAGSVAGSTSALPDEVVIDESVPAGSQEQPVSLRLAVFLSDGSALLTHPAWFSDDGGRAVHLSVNAWTGLPKARPLAEVLASEPVEPTEQVENEEAKPDGKMDLPE